MNYPDRPTRPARPIELATEADFVLGGLQVSPALRVLRTADRQEVIEPRAMQVLVALVRAGGAVLSRDTLIEQCWGGRVVGDDAINSCIAKVRAAATLTDPPAYSIETIPRVGYQLKAVLPPRPPAPAAKAPDSSPTILGAGSDGSTLPAAKRLPWKWIGAVAAMALVVGGALAAALLSRPPSAGRWTVARLEVPIATSLIERHPSISPDGTMIAYSAGPDILTRKIYIQRISGGEPIRLTNDDYDDVSPAWSPDGNEVAYVTYKAGEHCRLMIVQALAGTPREAARCTTDERSHVVWAASGAEVFFLDRTNPKSPERVMRLQLDSGQRTQLTRSSATAHDDHEPTVSPDGRWISFERDMENDQCQRVVFDLNSGDERRLKCDSVTYNNGNAWSEDSTSIFVSTESKGQHEIWSFPIDGSLPERVLASPESIGRLASGPNGLLAVEINRLTDGLARTSTTDFDKPHFTGPDYGNTYTPDVSRNGTIAAEVCLPGNTGIWIVPRDGPAHKIFAPEYEDAGWSEPRWSPDGSKIAITPRLPSRTGIRIISGSGAFISRILFPGSAIDRPAWSADGKTLIFPGFMRGEWRLWRADLTGRLTALPYTGWIDVQMRGTEIYGIRQDRPGVWRVDGRMHQITRTPSPGDAELWTIADDEIAYVVNAYGARKQIFGQPIAGGPAHLIAEAPNFVPSWGVAYDPSTHSFLYVARISAEADIGLIHLVRQ